MGYELVKGFVQELPTDLDDLTELTIDISTVREILALVDEMQRLLDQLTDPSPCWHDHHGGCQAHLFLELEFGETCPNLLSRRLLEELRS